MRVGGEGTEHSRLEAHPVSTLPRSSCAWATRMVWPKVQRCCCHHSVVHASPRRLLARIPGRRATGRGQAGAGVVSVYDPEHSGDGARIKESERLGLFRPRPARHACVCRSCQGFGSRRQTGAARQASVAPSASHRVADRRTVGSSQKGGWWLSLGLGTGIPVKASQCLLWSVSDPSPWILGVAALPGDVQCIQFVQEGQGWEEGIPGWVTPRLQAQPAPNLYRATGGSRAGGGTVLTLHSLPRTMSMRSSRALLQ